MQKEAARKLIQDTLEGAFDKKQFKKFTKELLNHLEDAPFTYRGEYIYKDYRDSVKTLERIGKYEDSYGKKIDVLIVNLLKTPSLERARSKQRNFVAKYLKGSRGNELKDGALVAFVSPDEQDWRFSFVKMEYKFDTTKKGQPRIKEEFTPARRYSFLVGENEGSHTAQSKLLPILEKTDSDPTLADIEDAFNIEKVTKEFFDNYRSLFHEIKDALDEFVKKDNATKTDFREKGVDTVDFTKKLLGQIVFLYFLQKKGWFGVGKRSEWGTGPKRFLRELFDKKRGEYKNFFNDILEPLFYNTLAVERPGDYSDKFDCRIPFLNGGLFDPLNDYDWQRTDILLSNNLFSNDEKTKQGDVGTGILDVFDRYNFTVKEDEPLEKEVAIDPEMLGKVFENLLEVKDRKSKGTYYTPREIVHYMCQESLINYLATELKEQVERENIEMLIKHGEAALENDTLVSGQGEEKGRYKYKLPKSIREHNEFIDRKLAEIKVCDPAVGSGAFLVGMMSEIVKTRSVLARLSNPNEEPNIYDFKRDAIQDSLHGVDIDLGAVEIAKLRLWLSLIVDEENYKHIKPLPNLDYKIMQGNSLLEEYEGIKLIDERFFQKQEEIISYQDRLNAELKLLQYEYIHEPGRDKLPVARRKEIEARTKEIQKQLKSLTKPKTNGQGPFDMFGQTEAQSKADKLLELHERFFNVHHKSEKDSIHKQIDELTWDLIESTLKQKGKEDKLEEVKRFQRTNTSPFFLWKLNFADVYRTKEGFDVVVANPPYKQLSKDKSVSDSYKKALKNKYGTSAGRLNTFVFFIHEGLSRLNERGVISYIVPNTILTQDYYSYTRKTIIETTTIHSIVSYDDMQFESAVVENITFVLTKGVDSNVPINIYRQDKDSIQLLRQKQSSEFCNPPRFVFGISENSLADKILSQGIDILGEYCNVNQAIALKGDKSRSLKYENPNGKYYKLLDGRNIGKFFIHWGGVYLDYDLKRIHSCKRRDIFEADEKLLFRRVSSNLMFTYDDKQYYALNTLVVVTNKETSKWSLKYLLAILNSKLLNYVYKTKFKSTKKVFSEIQARSVARLPVKSMNGTQQKEVLELISRISSLADSSDYKENKSKQSKVSKYEEQIDRMVYRLYDLTPEEIGIVEGKYEG